MLPSRQSAASKYPRTSSRLTMVILCSQSSPQFQLAVVRNESCIGLSRVVDVEGRTRERIHALTMGSSGCMVEVSDIFEGRSCCGLAIASVRDMVLYIPRAAHILYRFGGWLGYVCAQMENARLQGGLPTRCDIRPTDPCSSFDSERSG